MTAGLTKGERPVEDGLGQVPASRVGDQGGRIRLLPDSLINKIAAGEVIERPASVVKELVENALDAGASRIQIEVESGGRASIKVTDDGCGMSPEDALLALRRHATSKLRTDADLFRIASLGFRGEALPSIAEVSRLALRTGEAEALSGVEVLVDGGVLGEVRESPNPGGTEIEVRRLFFNTPVRLRFLRSPRTEMAHLTQAVQRLALAHPEVAFVLRSGGKSLMDLPGVEGLRARVEGVFGRKTAARLHSLHRKSGDLRLEGLISGPEMHRSSNAQLHVFVNGRPVQDRRLVGAVLQAYRGAIPKGRYPLAVLFVDLPAEAVDHNVHPAKSEVRFQDGRSVWQLFSRGLDEALRRVVSPETAAPMPAEIQSSVQRPAQAGSAGLLRPLSPSKSSLGRAGFGSDPQAVFGVERLVGRAMDRAPEGREIARTHDPGPPSARSAAPRPPNVCERTPLSQAILRARTQALEAEHRAPYSFGALRPLCRFGEDYWLLRDEGALVLLSIFSCLERLSFEALVAAVANPRNEVLPRLLVPALVDLDPEGAARLLAEQDRLLRLGVEISDLGRATIAVHALSPLLEGPAAAWSLRAFAEGTFGAPNTGSEPGCLRHLASVLASGAAAFGRHRFDESELSRLLSSLDDLGEALCPHGQPLVLRLTEEELSRRFGLG